jgi:hypothetical protein
MGKMNYRQTEDAAFALAQFPNRPKKNSGKRAVLVGANVQDDLLMLNFLSQRLALARGSIAHVLKDKRRWDVYDITTKPEKGDAIDHLGDDVLVVVACHIPMYDVVLTTDETLERLEEYKHLQGAYFYNKRNSELLSWCVTHRVPLLAYGDQPHPEDVAEQKVHATELLDDPLAVLYEAI